MVCDDFKMENPTLGSTPNIALNGLCLIPECQTRIFINLINFKPSDYFNVLLSFNHEDGLYILVTLFITDP